MIIKRRRRSFDCSVAGCCDVDVDDADDDRLQLDSREPRSSYIHNTPSLNMATKQLPKSHFASASIIGVEARP